MSERGRSVVQAQVIGKMTVEKTRLKKKKKEEVLQREENGYLSEVQHQRLIHLVQLLGQCYKILHSYQPLFGNNRVKNFLSAFVTFSLFDLLDSIHKLTSTGNSSSSQSLGLHTTAVHESSTTRATIELKGVGIFVNNSNGEPRKIMFVKEGHLTMSVVKVN